MLSRDELLNRLMPRAEVKLPGLGTVCVRGLSRAMVVQVQESPQEVAALEALVLHLGLADPSLSLEDAATLRLNLTTEEVILLIGEIKRLSGLGEGQAKAEYKSV